MFDVPVLVIIYNQSTETHNLFSVLKQIKPSRLYVAANGAIPNDRNDYALCLKARCVFMPNWDCQVNKLFKDEHLCKSKMLMQAMNWFFENENEGIVLFDDTLPHVDFFPYCKELLETYRDDMRIVHIGGTNMLKRERKNKNSYYFSAYAPTWGFATWKNRWKGFDLKMLELKEVDFSEIMAPYVNKKKEKIFWSKRYRILQNYSIDIWDYQYIFHLWNLKGYGIIPNVNLIDNIGFHNKKRKIRKLNRRVQGILPLRHNTEIIQDKDADKYIFKHYYHKELLTAFADWVNENLLGKEKKI